MKPSTLPLQSDLGPGSCAHQFATGLCRASLPKGVDVPAHRDLPPHAGFGLLREPAPRVHHQHAIGRQPIHVTIRVLPLGCFFLGEGETDDIRQTEAVWNLSFLGRPEHKGPTREVMQIALTPRKMFLEESKPAA